MGITLGRRCNSNSYQQTGYYYQPQSNSSQTITHQPTDIAVTSQPQNSEFSSAITFTAPQGSAVNINFSGRWSDGSYIPASNPRNASLASNTTGINDSAMSLTRVGDQVTIRIRRGFTGTFNIGGRIISTEATATPPVTSSPTTTSPSAPTVTPQTTPTQPLDAIGRILAGLTIATRTPTTEQPYGGVIAFDAPAGTVRVRYESASGSSGFFSFQRNTHGGPLESNINGVAYIQASPTAYRQVGSGCGSYLVPSQNHFGIGIDPNFRGRIIVEINGRERVLEYPPQPVPLENPLQRAIRIPLQDPIPRAPQQNPPIPELDLSQTPLAAPISFTPVSSSEVPTLATNGRLTVPRVEARSLNDAITNFRYLTATFSPNIEAGTHWDNTDSFLQRRRIATFMQSYAQNIANAINLSGDNIRINDRDMTPREAREYFQNLSQQYQGIFNRYGL